MKALKEEGKTYYLKLQITRDQEIIYIDKSYNFLKICNQIKGFQIKIELTGYKFLNILIF